MAGNESVARQRAYDALKDAERSGADAQTLGKLRADLQTKQNAENNAMGTSGQARTPFGF